MNLRTPVVRWLLRGLHPRDPALAGWLTDHLTAAGMPVTVDSAMRVSAFFATVRVLAETLASVPLIVYRRLPKGGRERAVGHWSYPLLHNAPNGWMTSFGWREMGVAQQCLRGATYAEIVGDRRGRRSLIPLRPEWIKTIQRDDGALAYEYRTPVGSPRVLLQDEVLRIPFMTLDGIKVVTPIQAQRETLSAALGAQDYTSRFWANDARPTGGYIEAESDFKDPDALKKFRDSWQDARTGENRHKVAFLPRGMKYHQFAMTMEDAQFIETRKFTRSEIAGMMRVPPHMIGDLERTTFSNVEQQSIDFLVYTMAPWFRRWEQAINSGLFTEAEQETYYAEFLVDGLLRGDATARANYFRTAILTGWMSRNEVREIENMNRADGLDDFIVPLNMAPTDLLADLLKGPKQ